MSGSGGGYAVILVDGEKASATVRTPLDRTRNLTMLNPAQKAVFVAKLPTAW